MSAASGTTGGRALGALMRTVYRAAGAAVGGASALQSLTATSENLERLGERQGRWPGHAGSGKPWIWIQAASVGEAEIAVAVAHVMAARLANVRMVVSSTTPTGAARVRREHGIESRYFPIDFAPFVNRIVDPLPPLLFVSVETEIWPELLRLLHERGVPTAVVNARLSDRSLPRYRRLAPLVAPLLAAMKVCARDEDAARRWRSIGADGASTEVTGNIKFDLVAPRLDVEIPLLFERRAERPLLLAASTHDGEEEFALHAFALVRAKHKGARLLLAPRHPRRAAEAFPLARSHWLAAVAWSDVVGMAGAQKGDGGEQAAAWPARVDVVVLDRLGLLRSAYASALACFVGGSAVPGPGGHNLLEPAVAMCPVAAGPHLENVADQAEALDCAGALRIVENPTDLAKFWLEAIENPVQLKDRARGARNAVAARRGALDRSVEALLALVGARAGSA